MAAERGSDDLIKVGGVTREIWVILLVPPVGSPSPVTGGEGMIHVTVYGPKTSSPIGTPKISI